MGGGARGGGATGADAAGNLLSPALSSHVEERGKAVEKRGSGAPRAPERP